MGDTEVIVKKKLGLFPKILLGVIFLLLFLFAWMHFLEPKVLIVKDEILQHEKLPDSYNGFTIVHFSDIHFGRTTNEQEVEELVKKINECKADVLLFSGDLFDSYINLSDANIEFLKASFQKLNARLKKYAVFGDQDYLNESAYESIMKESGFEILNGTNQVLYYHGNTPIYISGVSSITKQVPDYTEAFKKDSDSLQLFLSHEPSVIQDVKHRADYVFSGHSLGGLIRIPFLGGIVQFENTNGYETGKYLVDQTTLFVSNGIGTQEFSLRFFNFPSFYCYRFIAN